MTRTYSTQPKHILAIDATPNEMLMKFTIETWDEKRCASEESYLSWYLDLLYQRSDDSMLSGNTDPKYDFLGELALKVQQGIISMDDISTWRSAYLDTDSPPTQKLIGSHTLRCFFALLAQIAIQHKNYVVSRYYLYESLVWHGKCEVITNREYDFRTNGSAVDLQRKGGRARGTYSIQTQEKVMKLLVEKRPETGWKNYGHAIKTIYKDIKLFEEARKGPGNRREKGALSIDNLEKTMRRWMSGSGGVAKTFWETASKEALLRHLND